MKHGLLYTLGLIVVGMVAFAASPANAQTTANGPYYATPSWDQTLACTTTANCPRFVVLSNMGSNAVLDRETGLVWERSPSTTHFDWWNARSHCMNLTVGNRLGWRVPTFQELLSLIDPTQSNPALPAGHPFINVQGNFYWSATTYATPPGDSSIAAYAVRFSDALIVYGLKTPILIHDVWCVRGGQGVDPQ